MMTGTEHEYSINSPSFIPQAVSDIILERLAGKAVSEVPFGSVTLCKELQKTVIEFVPRKPSHSLAALENEIQTGINKFYRHFNGEYSLLGLGMHPSLTLDQTAVWDHDEGEYYEVYDRLFGLRQHGWLNIQALQINIAYRNENHMVGLFNSIRRLIPYLVAITAASPFVEGRTEGPVDNRLLYYMKNQGRIPLICHEVIPEKLGSLQDYRKYQAEVYHDLREQGGECLCEEWVASSGVIIRFTRPCIEIKAIDEQECIRSDIAVCAFTRALLRDVPSWLEEERFQLIDLTKDAIQHGTARIKPELERLYASAMRSATPEERLYLPVIESRILEGSLGEQMVNMRKQYDLPTIMGLMESALRENRPFMSPEGLFAAAPLLRETPSPVPQ